MWHFFLKYFYVALIKSLRDQPNPLQKEAIDTRLFERHAPKPTGSRKYNKDHWFRVLVHRKQFSLLKFPMRFFFQKQNPAQQLRVFLEAFLWKDCMVAG